MKSAYILKSPFLALSLRELMMMKDSGYPMSAYDVDPSIMPLLGLPHRQFVFTLPKALRVFLRYDQHLFGELSRLMYSIGQDQNLLGLDNTSLGTIQLTKGNGIDADPDTFQTSVAGVFAGGDVVTGPATAVEAIAAEDFFTVSLMTTTVLAVDELVTDIFIPSPKAGTRFSFQKFRVRNSIDFPIVSVASALTFDGAKIKEARIVFGAVAPIPLRAANVEEALVGRTANEETAELAENTATTPSLCPT
jgi:hypothetical protein